MKVAYFIGSLNRGGTEMLTLDICRRHAEAPYDMLLVYRNEGNMSDMYRETGVQMKRIKPKRFHFLRYLWQLHQFMKQEQVDVVHAQTLANGVIAVFFLLFTRIKLVTTFHGFFYGIKSAIFRHIVMWGSNATIYVSQYVKDWYVAHSWCNAKKCHTVYNGVNFSKLDANAKSDEFSKEPKRMKLVMVGSFVAGRSPMVLVQAIELLSTKYPEISNFDFYFVGRRVDAEPWIYDDCVQYCNTHHMDNVHFLGGRSDVPSILKSMDGFVYSTVDDTFGIGVVEAMAAGLPVVINDWPVMKEVCGEANDAVRYYKSGDIVDAAEAIAALLKGNETSKHVAQNNAIKVRNKYSIENHINKLNEIYKSK